MIIRKIKEPLLKHKTTFLSFLIIGILKTFSAIFLNWILIDILKIKALAGSSIAYGLVFIGTYIAYVKSNTIHKGFLKYTIVVVAFNLLAILLVTLLVDVAGLKGYMSSAITTAALFLLRYLVLNKFGIIKTD